MRALSFIVLGAAVLAQQQPIAPDEDSRRPIIVPNLGGPAPASAIAPAATNVPLLPATVAAGGVHHHHGSLHRLQKSIEEHQVTLEQLSKQLEDGLRQKQRLQLAQRLMTAIISLKKAERVLQRIDHAVKKYKKNIKRAGEQADEIADSIKRSEAEHKRELAEQGAKLDALRKSLAKQERKLTGLASRRGRVVRILKKWKEHVATLRDAHEAYNVNSNAAPHRHGALAVEDLAAPPSTSSVLREIGLARPPSRDSFLRGALAPSDYRPKLNQLVEADSVTAAAADAAVAEVWKATVRELGGRTNLPAFQGVSQPRFAAAEAEAGAEASAEGEADADVDAELDAELGMDLEEPAPLDSAHEQAQQQHVQQQEEEQKHEQQQEEEQKHEQA